jgi:hypothetical protein
VNCKHTHSKRALSVKLAWAHAVQQRKNDEGAKRVSVLVPQGTKNPGLYSQCDKCAGRAHGLSSPLGNGGQSQRPVSRLHVPPSEQFCGQPAHSNQPAMMSALDRSVVARLG